MYGMIWYSINRHDTPDVENAFFTIFLKKYLLSPPSPFPHCHALHHEGSINKIHLVSFCHAVHSPKSSCFLDSSGFDFSFPVKVKA